ncbi:MBL fold metallo-hydrolase [Shewanella sp. MF08487]|uniref:MBL fold metallo-hydrolase n=1 Tax=Shewanella sp. MF08487 TaxID=3434873 RepID=UPI003D79AE8E
MKSKAISTLLTLGFASIINSTNALAESVPVLHAESQQVHFQHIRNATSKITYGNTTFLIDPMLSKKDTYPGFAGTYRSEIRIPMVDLPMTAKAVIDNVDAVIVTHTHLDHWDDAAQSVIPKTLPLFVQNEEDANTIRAQGFKDVRVLGIKTQFNGISLTKTGGQHGTDEMYAIPEVAKLLGEAMGVVLQADNYSTVYFVGDTIWRNEVEDTLRQFKPEVVVLNTGDARLDSLEGSIIMGEQDTLRAIKHAPQANIVAVHMDTVNHAALTRKELREFVKENGIEKQVLIPEDGESLKL